MNVLFITRHYLDQKNGGALGARAYLDAFASIYGDVTLLYPEHQGLDISLIVAPNVIPVPSFDYRSKIIKGMDIYRGRVHRFAKDLKRLLSQNKHYDIIVFDHSILGAELIDIIKKLSPSSKLITIHCNIEQQYNRDNPVSCLYRKSYTHAIEKAERDALEYSVLNMTVTQEDADYFETLSGINSDTLEYWGTFEYNGMTKVYNPSEANKSKRTTIVISGSLNFPQSENAIMEFLDRYYSIAKDVDESVRLIITGRNPSNKIQNECRTDNTITLVPSPDDINAVVRKGNIYCSPVYGGSGVKLRIMDGLKLGLPVLCHQNSAKGYEMMIANKCMFTYHDKLSFKEAFSSLLYHRPNSDEVYSTYINRFGFEAGCERLRKILAKHNLIYVI